MIKRLNSFLRAVFFVFGGLFLLLEFLPEAERELRDTEGFDGEEFDDIW